MTRPVADALLTSILVVALSGCASPPGGGRLGYTTSPQQTAGAGRVTVNVDASPLKGDRRDAFLEHRGSEKIGGAMVLELAASGKSGHGTSYTVNVTVTHFRLRSSQTGFWLGWMAGADKVGVLVTVVRNHAVEKSFSTVTSTAVAGLIRPGAVRRFDRMVRSIVKRIVAGI